MQVELLNTGTELLMGFVVNTHASWLGQKLNAIGATLVRQTAVGDDLQVMRDAMKEALPRADLILVTGGLGPTGDDITRNCALELFELRTRIDQRVMQNIEERLRRRGIQMRESLKCQAIVPEIGTVLYNQNGTAPGLAVPVQKAGGAGGKACRCRWIVMLPGPPNELRPMFEDQALPWIRTEYASLLPKQDCRVLHVVGTGESAVEEWIVPVLKNIQGLEIGYCARPGEVDVRLVVRGQNDEEVRTQADEAEKRVREAVGGYIFGSGSQTLEQVVVDLLREKKKWLATAESCTGGGVANRITMAPGSSDVFLQGWVTYSNESKTRLLGVPADLIRAQGAVSEPVARAMAEGARRESGADYALALTGIAGPSGGTPEKPVGTVFIALASPERTVAEKSLFPMSREMFKFIATQTALNLLRKELAS
jgi:nicotinamide-nucleotide amidase